MGRAKMDNRIQCWHFVSEDKRLRWGTRRTVEVGKTYSCRGPLVMCEHGMHGSRRIIDALQYAPGPWICRVEIWGDVEEQTDKLVGRNRRVLAMVDGTRLLHLFACRVAERALKKAHVTDKRSWRAIEVKRAWLDGGATDEELAAAWDAAGAALDAALTAAWDAAGAAARAAAGAAAGAARAIAGEVFNRYLTALVEREIRHA